MPGLGLTAEQLGRVLQGEHVGTEDDQGGYIAVYFNDADQRVSDLNAELEQTIAAVETIADRLAITPGPRPQVAINALRQLADGLKVT